MRHQAPFHLLYVPRETIEGTRDRILSLIQTEDPDYVQLIARILSGSVVMQLEAENAVLPTPLFDLLIPSSP